MLFLDQELISHTATHLVLVAVLVGRPLQKILWSVVSSRIRMKFGRIVLHVNTHRLTESDFLNMTS